MPDLPIIAPAGYIPLSALSFSSAEETGIVVDRDHPLPVGEASFGGAVPIVPDTDQTPRRAIAIVAATAGNVALRLADGSTFTLPVQIGLSILPFAVRTVASTGTTATATYANLI